MAGQAGLIYFGRTPPGRMIFERGEAAIRHYRKERNDGNPAFARERTGMFQPNTRAARVRKVRHTTIVSRSAARVMPV